MTVNGVGSVELSFHVWGSKQEWLYQWFKDEAALISRHHEYEGIRSKTLKIITANRSMEGQYHCLAECQLARVRSRSTTLKMTITDRSRNGKIWHT